MRALKTAITIILLLSLYTAAYSQGEPGPAKGEPVSAQEKAAPAKDDDRLPIFKEGWQIFLAPYIWIPGAHLNVNQNGVTSKADIPWYDLVPVLFSQAIGAMGSVEIWYDRWGFFSDTNFLYMSDSVSGGGAREVQLENIPIPVRLQLSGNLKIWTRLLWQDVGVRRLLGVINLNADKPLPALSCELFAGLRYTYINQDVKLDLNATLIGPPGTGQITRGGSFYSSSHRSFFEPLLGVRLGFWLTPRVNLRLRADCGGFGIVAYNNVDTVLEAFVGYRLRNNLTILAGYRGRYASGSTETSSAHGWFHGPMLGTVYGF
jgi:hypothetical protein